MKYFISSLLVWMLLCFFSITFAEEPILVIDPHGHSSPISQILFTSDGKTLISVSEDKTVRLWDVETGDLKKTLRPPIGEGRMGMLFSAACSPDGKLLAVGTGLWAEGLHEVPVYLFELESGKIIGTLEGHEDIISGLDFSHDGKWLASGSSTAIRIWNVSTFAAQPKPVVILESDSETQDLAFSPDGKAVVSGHSDGTLWLWELPEDLENASTSTSQKLNEPKKVMKKHTNVVNSVEYSPDGKYIISGDYDWNRFLWDTNGKIKKKLPPSGGAGIAFSQDSKKVVVSHGPEAVVYSVPKGKKITTFTKHVSPVENNAFSNSITAMAIYGNDLVATAGGNDYDIYLWDINTGAVKTHIAGQGKRVEAVAFGQDLQVAFGNTSGGINKAGPLERSFDFAEMVLNQKTPDEKDFRRTQTEYEGKKLQYTPGRKNPENWYMLKVKGGGTIKNERKHGWVRSYTFTPNGDVVVGSSHVLKLHRSDGTFIRDFVGHTGEVWDVSASPDGKILASASDDQTIRLWNLDTGERLATLFIARDREWVCWTPKGYYTASAGGEKYIGWHLSQGVHNAAKYYPVSVFRKRFHYPELVKRTIALGNFEQALAEINIKETTVAEALPPEVQWISPEAPTVETPQASIRLQAKIHSDTKLTAVKVLVNGRTQATERGLAVAGEQRAAISDVIDQEVALTPGRNEIAIFAANENAGAPSEIRVVIHEAEALNPDLYMVSIGISVYQRSDLQLNYADDDAKAISQVFREQEEKLFKRVIIKELYDQEATQENILKAVEWLKNQATQKDVAVVFVAAHGTNEQGKYYLLPTDGDPTTLEQTGVSWKNFSKSLGNLPSRVLLFLDTCHSGQLGQDVYTLRKQIDNTEAIRELSSDEYGVVILAASTGKEFSLEHPDWEHGAFTKALIEAMDQGQADYSDDGIILLRELDLYIAERVDVLTDGEQHPTTQKPSTISRFPVVQVK